MADTVLEKRNPILKFFPVPRYLALGAVACSIEHDVLRFLELAPNGNNMLVRHSGERILPAPLVNDADDISPDIKKAIAKFVFEEKIRSIAIVLPERLTYAFFITIPIVEPAFIREALAFKLEEHIPIAPGDVLFEYDVIKQDERAKTMTIAVRAVPQKQAEKYAELFSSLGVLVSGCETEGKAALLSALSPRDAVCRLVIKIGKAGTIIFIAEGSSVLFSSSLSFGADTITGVNEKSLPTLNSIKDEAKKVIGYWNTRPDVNNTAPAGEILLFGSTASYAGVREYFEAALAYPTTIANVWHNTFSLDEVVPAIGASQALDFASVIGLSLSQ